MTTRIGFVGAGVIANRHLGVLLGFDDACVVAAADPSGEQVRAFVERCGATPYGDVEAMLRREALDALYICVPPFAHGAPEEAAIARGVPFFVEKPLAADLPTAEGIAQRVAQSGLPTAVGYHWRYLDTVTRARDLLRERPARLALGYWLDFTPPPAWWTSAALSGGQLVEQTTHIFDLARVLVGEVTTVYTASSRLPRPAFPTADIDNASAVTLHFASGAVGAIASTSLLHWPHRIGLHLFAEGMAIELSEFELMVDVGQGRPVLKAAGDPFAAEDRDFIDAVQGKPNHIRVPYEEALRTHRLAVMAARSAREGRPLEIPGDA
jgi:predicted dehydrogenase